YGRHCEALGYSEFNRYNRANFATELDWVKDTQKRLDSWGFNYAGTCARLFRDRLPFADNLMIGSTFASLGDEYDISPYRGRVGTALPNPFHPRFEEYAARRFRRALGADIENPYLLGYYCDNELRWQPGAIDGSGVFDTVLKKKSSHTAKIALKDFLKERFKGDISRFNKFWNTNFKDFDAVLEAKVIKHTNDEQLKVKVDFLAFTAETYFRKLRDTLKKEDPNHLFLGCRYAGAFSAHPEVWKVNGKYCDVVSFNIYPQAEFSWNRLFLNRTDVNRVLDEVYKLAGRPMMITEWAYNGLDSGLPCTNGAGQRFATQRERARAAGMFYRTMLNHKGMVGVSWYEYSDDPYLGVRRRHPENNNYGLVNKFNQPYEELVNTFSRINDDIDASRAAALEGRDFKKQGNLYKAFNDVSGQSSKIKITRDDSTGQFSVSNGEITIARGSSRTPVRYFLGRRHVGNIYFKLRSIGWNRVNEWSRAYDISNVRISHLTRGAQISYTVAGKCKRGKFSIDVRLLVPEKGRYCIVEVVNIKNISCHLLQVAGVYIVPEPLFTRIPNVEPFMFGPNSGKRADAWCAPDYTYFGAASSLGLFAVSYYKRDREGYKYDVFSQITANLKKGEICKPEIPAYVFVYSGKGSYLAHGKELIEQDIK
ncbi:MAG: beta-galactosidase, partial [Lentisphaeria bacterium]|nr:beta-galactosidase [Lentisphaeria bacterium]